MRRRHVNGLPKRTHVAEQAFLVADGNHRRGCPCTIDNESNSTRCIRLADLPPDLGQLGSDP
jgi:hypothetical protein